ncbi:neuropeptide SIFamide receptor-like [Acropora muricata]|uniref:neuropeptide SIFamide receptor-like n=1 Tax=Acropora muricata TaxID=159855 RepID=UPI0034E5478A
MSGNSSTASFTSNSSNAGSTGMSKEEKLILMPFYCISLLVALIGNVLIILVFYKYKPIRKSINYFVLNMAISDLFTPLTIMPYIIVSTLSNDSGFLNQLPSRLAGVICKLCFFLADSSFDVSIVSLLMISLDRLIAVVFPLQIKLISMKVRFICIFMSWVVAFSVHGVYLRLMDNFEGVCYLDLDAESFYGYRLAIFIALFFIPVCLLTIIYGAIAVTLKGRRRKRKNMSTSKKSHDHSNRKIIVLSVAILAGFIISIGPLVVYRLIVIISKGKDPPGFEYPALKFIITKLLFHSWGAFNPCMCFAFCGNYRTGLQHVFFGGSRAGSLSLSANTKLTSSRKRTRSSSSDHFNIKAAKGNGNEWFKLTGEEKDRSQEQEKGNSKQEQKL